MWISNCWRLLRFHSRHCIFTPSARASGYCIFTRVSTVRMKIRLPLFWRTWKSWNLALDRTLPHVQPWLIGWWAVIIAFVLPRSSEKKCLKRHGYCIFLNCRKYWKISGPHVGVFNPHLPDCFSVAVIMAQLSNLAARQCKLKFPVSSSPCILLSSQSVRFKTGW